ncbi:MAG: hypothetical protein ACREAB_21840 [Blastocatellia bacterium]
MIIVAVFLFAFPGFGLQTWKELRLHRMIRDEPGALRAALEPEASTDGYIRELLAADVTPRPTLSRPAAAVRAALAELPPEGAVLFLAPRKLPRYEVMFLTVKTLTLPRSIHLLWCDDSKQIQNAQNAQREKAAAVMFYLVSPPSGISGVKTIIPHLAIAPVSESTTWTSYCSQ